jgi:RNA polymerase sigma-70 factor (ECF subfamily)
VQPDDVGALVTRAAAGDRDAADSLVRRFAPVVRADVHRRLGADVRAREDTDDILQSTLVEAIGALEGFEFRGEAAFRGWLATLAENRVRMAGRFHRQAMRDPAREDGPPVGTGGPSADGPSPSVAAGQEESTRRLSDAVAALPPEERTVVDLHSYRGLAFPEVARLAGLRDAEAARYLFRKALKTLSESLDADA